MSSFSSPSPLTVPFPSRRRNSLASTSISIDNHIFGFGDVPPSSSPLQSSSPLLTPLHLARSHECTKWQADDYFNDLDGVIRNQRDQVDDVSHSWSRHAGPAHSISYIHRPIPSLMTKFAEHTPWGDKSLPCGSSSFSAPQTTYLYPQGDSAIADDCEEYDLESMDIHIHETYFATSAERGRWLSSPIASRTRSQPTPPMRGHSSPIKTLADTSPLRECLRRRTKSCTVDTQISTSFSEDHDEDMRCSSSLPPSSPLTSPLSIISFLGDDCEDDVADDPCLNSDDCHSFRRTPELSISSTTCTSPVESARPPTPREPLAIVSAHPPTDSPVSAISCHLSPHQSLSPNPDVHTTSALSFESDGILSPLSQFELDLPEADHLKLPFSDMENKLYHGQRTASPSVTVDAVRSHNEPSSVQFPSMNPDHKPLDVSPGTCRANSNKSAKRRRENATNNPGARRTKKRAAIRPGSPSSDVKNKGGVENCTSTHSEPPSKKSRLSRCRDDSKNCGENSRSRRGGIPRVDRLWRSPSRPVVEDCESESACTQDSKTSKSAAQLQPVPVGEVDAEFHASLTGMLIEAFATSRATSMDSTALYLVLTQAHPYLAAERSKQELLMDIAVVLEAGRARCGMFEKVDSSGERSRHKALESRWFYVPEQDEDGERASLISAIMPRQKRNETKKYKQYYYRPVDKISRWDPEDAT